MTLSSFRFNVLVRILLICLLISLLIYVAFQTTWVVTSIVLFIATCFVIAELFRYVEATNREFSDFLQSIKGSDFTRYSEDATRGKSFSKLRQAFNAIVAEFQRVRVDNEAHYTFLQTVVNNVNTAIISFDNSGSIKLLNDTAKTLLDFPFLSNVHQLNRINPELHQHLISGVNGIAEIRMRDKNLKLLFRSASFRMQDDDHKLILITNIKSEIDRTEVEAWEQLLHVLTHEIMNSITPISSLSGTIRDHLNMMIEEKRTDGDMLNDMAEGLQVITNRSAGLISFVNNYKSLIALPKPELKKVKVDTLFYRIRLLVSEHLREKHISFRVRSKSDLLIIVADDGMIEQVLLNLVYNAADAVKGIDDPVIELSVELQDDRTVIRVSDNGAGIDQEILNKIFIPFFTTKNKGTGIGLTLSRQIMRLHNGSIDVQSVPGEGTVFTLGFS